MEKNTRNNQELIKKKEDPCTPNFEKLYMNIVELKQEALKTFSIFSSHFKENLLSDPSTNTKEINAFLDQIQENKAKIAEGKIISKLLLSVFRYHHTKESFDG